MHPSKKAEELLEQNKNLCSLTYALLAIADALQNVSTSIDKLKEGFLSIEIVSER